MSLPSSTWECEQRESYSVRPVLLRVPISLYVRSGLLASSGLLVGIVFPLSEGFLLSGSSWAIVRHRPVLLGDVSAVRASQRTPSLTWGALSVSLPDLDC